MWIKRKVESDESYREYRISSIVSDTKKGDFYLLQDRVKRRLEGVLLCREGSGKR